MAPPSVEGAPLSVETNNVGNPFHAARANVSTNVKHECQPCAKCMHDITATGHKRPATCDVWRVLAPELCWAHDATTSQHVVDS